jgi:hypothetical protein
VAGVGHRKLLVAVAAGGAVALLGAATVALMWLEGGRSPAAPDAPLDARARSVAAEPPRAVARLPASLPPPDDGPPAPVRPAEGLPPEEADPAWRETPFVSRFRDLGPVAAYVIAGLKNAREEMGFCFEAAAGARAAATGEDESSPAVLVLYLEARQGAIDVVDARTDDPGSAPRELVECCRGVLLGHEIPAPNAVPGRRFRLMHLVP